MLPKAHLTLHSRMSGSRCVITTLWLFGSWSSFFHSFFVYSCHLFLISSASVRSMPFLSFIVPIFTWKYSLGISNFLEEISSLYHSVIFLYFFALITEEGFLIYPCYSLEPCIQMIYLSFCPFPVTSFLFSTICKALSDNHFALLHSFFLGMVSITAFCTMSQIFVHSSSGTLLDLIF